MVPNGAETGPIKVLTSEGSFSTDNDFIVEEAVPSIPFSISSFSPETGDAGTEVTLLGNFEQQKENNTVIFGPVSTASPHFSDGSTLKVNVPAQASTQRISIRFPNASFVTSNKVFYLPPKIDHFDHNSGPEGFIIRIYCMNHDPIGMSKNIVKINGVQATVLAVSSEYLRVEIPAGATSGPITLETPGGIATSPVNFTVVD